MVESPKVENSDNLSEDEIREKIRNIPTGKIKFLLKVFSTPKSAALAFLTLKAIIILVCSIDFNGMYLWSIPLDLFLIALYALLMKYFATFKPIGLSEFVANFFVVIFISRLGIELPLLMLAGKSTFLAVAAGLTSSFIQYLFLINIRNFYTHNIHIGSFIKLTPCIPQESSSERFSKETNKRIHNNLMWQSNPSNPSNAGSPSNPSNQWRNSSANPINRNR